MSEADPTWRQGTQLFQREIGREVLFGDRRQGAFGFGKNGVGRANPDAVQQSVDR